MIKLGLLGSNISHSRSKEMYESLLGEKVDYNLIDIQEPSEIPSLKNLFLDIDLEGLSITFPHKKHFLSDVVIEDSFIKSLNAINCIGKDNNKFIATNTDYLAAVCLLQKKYCHQFDKFIILGSGNMATVFEKSFEKLSINFESLNRREHGDLNKVNYEKISSGKTLLINCCSRDFIFNPKKEIRGGFWDMNYSFEPHSNLESFGLKYFEGVDLLREQAKFALKFWGKGHLIKNQ